VSQADHRRGAQNPIVTITEYVDYQDFMSGLFEKEAGRLLEKHPDELLIVSRIFPQVNTNDKAALAAQAAEAAGEQGKFWKCTICSTLNRRIGPTYRRRISNSGSPRKRRLWE
jgi:hypothetical protein